MKESYETHKYAEMFPTMQSDEFTELVNDVRQNGLLEPITTMDGKILDGRSRLRACIAAKVEPKFIEFDGDDPLAFVWTKNFARRHLSTSQRAIAALQFSEMVKTVSKERMRYGGKISASKNVQSDPIDLTEQGVTFLSPLDDNEKGRTVDKLAEIGKVSRGTMQSALFINREAPELLPDIKADKLSIGAAAEIAKNKKGGVSKPKGEWQKIEALAEKLNAALSAVDLPSMVNLEILDKLREVGDRIKIVTDSFEKGRGQ